MRRRPPRSTRTATPCPYTTLVRSPDATIAEISKAGLRGRGGGGFPTGTKWAGVRSQTSTDRYVVVNGAEGEPGTFKDRHLLRMNPYQVVEGMIKIGRAHV